MTAPHRCWVIISASLIAVIVVGGLPFAINAYYVGLATTAGIFILSGLGLNLIAGFAGEFSFGQAAFFGVGAYTVGILMTRQDWSFVPSVLVAAVIAAVLALIIGTLTLRLSGVFFAIATLAVAEIVQIVATNWTSLTGGPSGLDGVPMIMSVPGFFWLILVLILLVIAGTELMRRSWMGRALAATRQSAMLARSVGINTRSVKRWAFVACGVLAALAGAVYATNVSALTPDIIGPYYSAVPLLIMVFGGRARTMGPVIGGICLLWIPGLFNLGPTTQLIAFGLVLIAITLALPGGLLDLPAVISARRSKAAGSDSAGASAPPPGPSEGPVAVPYSSADLQS